VENGIKNIKAPLKVAVMGCAVNGPGEARQADLGIAGGGNGKGLLFKKGKAAEVVDEKMMVERLLAEIHKMSLV
jgi:(E)-4-hydroxy-3-methylbut-2-enyl-diphosphate synthase